MRFACDRSAFRRAALCAISSAGMLLGTPSKTASAVDNPARRTQCQANCRMIGLGMLNCEAANGQLPTAIVDAEGKPLLSWRVAILPYIEEVALYEQFHLDEPWDSEHNKKLIGRMPRIYLCPSAPAGSAERGVTTYLGAAGPGMALEHEGAKLPAKVPGAAGRKLSFPDGNSKTILVVETAPDDAVPWTKPEELGCAPAEAHKQVFRGEAHGAGVRMLVFADGSTRECRPGVDPANFAAFLTRAGGESVSSDALD